MNETAANRLYALLPAIYRVGDAKQADPPLQALLAIIESELQILEADIDTLYDNWFIETCADWVVPYIGALLGAGDLSARGSVTGQQKRRAYVANTLAYRRRKGTAPVLEQLVRDVTGWRARAVEFFERLAIAQNLDHLRTAQITVSLRNAKSLDLLGTPFEQQVAYSASIRRTQSDRGWYNIPNIGLFLWRVQSYPLAKVTARRVKGADAQPSGRYYTFSPLGDGTIPLFNVPQTETNITHLADEINVPGELPLRPDFPGYGGANPVLRIFINGQPQPIPVHEVLITHRDSRTDGGEGEPEWQQPQGIQTVAVDPHWGRLAFLGEELPSRVEVSSAYGFSGDLGGGPYERMSAVTQSLLLKRFFAWKMGIDRVEQFFSPLFWEIEQARAATPNPLAEAVQTWNGTVRAWQSCQDLTAIPLARLAIPQVSATHLKSDRPPFKAGIVRGLDASATLGTNTVTVTAGLAVDSQGRQIQLEFSETLNTQQLQQQNISPPAQQTWLLVITYRAVGQSEPIPILETESDRYPEGIYLRLARLSVDVQGKILSVSNLKESFAAGIVQGLKVLTPPETLEAIVTSGSAVNLQGRPLVLDRNLAVDLRPYQNPDLTQTIRLAIRHSDRPARRNWQPLVIPKAESDRDRENTYILLAELYVPVVKISQLDLSVRRDRSEDLESFTPGVVRGLKVKAEPGARSLTVTPGQAVDGQGNAIALTVNYQISRLWRYRNQPLTLVMSYRAEKPAANAQITLLQPEEVLNYPEDTYLRLAQFTVNAKGQIESSPTDLRRWFKPGIVAGLDVAVIPESATLTVSDGTAVDSQGQPITLQQCRVDLSKHPGRVLQLFISSQTGQGWQPLDVQSSEAGRSWQQLGTVPEEPEDKIGIMLLKDNRTYPGNLALAIPADKQLQILAASGFRPHLQGNLAIQGTARSQTEGEASFTNPEPGELTLNGLLIEGQLTVLPGNLKSLRVIHCTLVPRASQWGLRVKPSLPMPASEETARENEEQDSWALMALVMYYLQLLRQFIWLGFKEPNLSAQQRFGQMTRFAFQVAHRFFDDLKQAIRQEKGLASEETDSEADEQLCWETPEESLGANIELQILLERTICSPIYLAQTVPELTIQDCIIDRGSLGVGGVAIAASGTDVTIKTTTVLGSMRVRSLEASESIFNERVTVLNRQVGCLRFCYVPDASLTPLRYRCQPDLALAEALSTFPAAIAALAINPLSGQIFVGTSGNGVFRSLDNGESWQASNQDLKNPQVTALVTYPQVGTGTISSQGTQVSGRQTQFKQELRKGNTIVAAHQIRTVTNDSADERSATIHAPFEPDLPRGTPFFISNQGQGTITSQGIVVKGKGTVFSQALEVDRLVIARNQIRTIRDLALTLNEAFRANLAQRTRFFKPQRGEGTISSDETNSTTIRISGSTFPPTLNPGDILIAANQIRTIVSLNEPTRTELTIDEAFSPNLEPETPFFRPQRGEGTISSDETNSTTIRISGSTFPPTLEPGDILIAANQIRTIVSLSESRTAITLNQPFNPELPVNSRFFWLFRGSGTISSDEKIVTGAETAFTRELRAGDLIVAQEQIRTVIGFSNVVLSLDQPFESDLKTETVFVIPNQGTGTIFSTGTTVTGNEQTSFTTELKIGDLMIAQGQSRIITEIKSQSELTLNQPFSKDLPRETQTPFFLIPSRTMVFAGTTGGSVFRSTDGGTHWTQIEGMSNNTDITSLVAYVQPQLGTIASEGTTVTGEGTAFTSSLKVGDAITASAQTRIVSRIDSDVSLTVERAFIPQLEPETPFKINHLYAGTAGGGVFRFSDTGNHWTPLNQNLSNQTVTAVAVNAKGQIFVGTAGDGVFRLSAANSWQAIDLGLKHLEITALAINERGTIYVGTAGGGVFYSEDNGNSWASSDRSGANPYVTALLAYVIQPETGTIVSEGTKVTGSDLNFETLLKVGDRLMAGGQTRTVTAIDSPTVLTIDTPFCPDLPPEGVELAIATLVVGTAGSGIDNRWSSLNDNLTARYITALARNAHNGAIFAGTAFGNLIRSEGMGTNWIPINQGLKGNVTKKLAILTRLQPIFTTTKYGQPGYAQFSQTCAQEIRRGAEEGLEMGVFNFLRQPQREANLQTSLDEHLRSGLTAGIFYIT